MLHVFSVLNDIKIYEYDKFAIFIKTFIDFMSLQKNQHNHGTNLPNALSRHL